MSSSSSHDLPADARGRLSMSVVKDAAVQCLLLTDHGTESTTTTTTTLAEERLSSGAAGMCVDMEAVYRGTAHQRRKAIVVAATGDETLLTQHPVDYR